jgi:uncharacterized protein involved in exopolysaccharide biosynthesis/Mrp family chromosome partitioning ATPase
MLPATGSSSVISAYQEEIRSGYGVREHLAVFFRHQKKIQLIVLMAILVAGPGSFLLTKIYRAEVRLLIQTSRTPFTMSTPLTGQVYTPTDISQKDDVATEVQIFTSPILLDKLVHQFGEERVMEGMRGRWDWLMELPSSLVKSIFGLKSESLHNQAVRKLNVGLSVEGVRQTHVFVATLESPKPDFAAEALNALVDIYMDHHLIVRKGKGSHEFFDEQTAQMNSSLHDAELRLQSFKDKWNIVSIEDQKRHLLQQVTQTEGALRESQVAAAETDVRIIQLRERLEGQQEAIPLTNVSERNPLQDQLKNRLLQMELEYAQYVPDSPAAGELQREMAAVRARLQAESAKVTGAATSGVNQTYQELKKNLVMEESRKESLRPRLAELSKQLKAYRDALNNLDQRELELRGLMREVRVKQEALDLYLKKEEESRIDEVLDRKGISNVTAIERAAVPEKAVRPRKFLNLLVGLMAGLIGGFGSAYASEYLRQSFTSRDEVLRALRRPVTAALPLVKSEMRDAQSFSIELRHAAQRIFRSYHEQGLKTILVTSTLRDEGRSYVSAAMARALNELKLRVLLITIEDYEQREPAPSARIASGAQTLPVMRHNIEEDPQSTDRQHLYRLRLQNRGGTALDFAERLTEVAKTMRDRFDLILLDAPPLPLFPEMRVTVAAIDGTLLVVEAEHTTRAAAARTLEAIEEAGGHVLGIVLNKCRYVIPGRVYDRFVSSERRSGRE